MSGVNYFFGSGDLIVAEHTYVYDAPGNLIAEYGGLNPTNTSYLYVDHLWLIRLLTDSIGNQTSCNDYLPFGGDVLSGTDGRGPCFASAACRQSDLVQRLSAVRWG